MLITLLDAGDTGMREAVGHESDLPVDVETEHKQGSTSINPIKSTDTEVLKYPWIIKEKKKKKQDSGKIFEEMKNNKEPILQKS